MDRFVKVAVPKKLSEVSAATDRGVAAVEEDLNSELMNEDIHIHSWPCSYYLDTNKQWVSGKLSLTPVAIKFTADKTGEVLVNFHLSSISEIKKESSNLIFSSLTILEKNTKHWFSSLQPSRNAVFNILEHFWREQLLSSQGAGAEAAALQSTKGKELTGLLTGSQKRLEDTAKVLHYQGEQFDNIMRGLNKIEGDMDVADRLLTELESPSWWPFSSKLWKAPLETKPKETATVSDLKNQEGIIIRIPVIITHRTDSNVKPGKLTLFASGLEISDCNSQVIHRFESKDVDDIKVHTPYEISVRQRFIGKPDTSYRLLSAKMPEAISVLEMQFSKKIQFLEDALGFVGARKSPQVDLGTSIWQADTEEAEEPCLGDRSRAGEAGRSSRFHHYLRGPCDAEYRQTEPQDKETNIAPIGTNGDGTTRKRGSGNCFYERLFLYRHFVWELFAILSGIQYG
ncbi:synaptosomal-associated protein 47 isoform X2 [Numida meleagris]|uniref:synaptosomal-associated protein 47 isoform X2 n=1 Tax=Numida meleagris TaxID=8996 RepID=UPI000B3DCC61|nr:synaptosomal-associated protein 47 isoform X2 [Numida meleagris]